jgi:endothelin-converting enzyme/putative endopeptidase
VKTTHVLLMGACFAGCLGGQTGGPATATPGLDVKAIDRNADPCADFYQYACGTWLADNPIPSDQSSWGRFSELTERNRIILRQILEEAATKHAADADTRKIGDYYTSCMDQWSIDFRGLEPIRPDLLRIDKMKSASELAGVIARLHSVGVNALFSFSSGQDFRDSTAFIGQVDQGGLGLPERDYYFRDDAKAKETREEYVAYLARMLELMGVSPFDVTRQAGEVMKLETELARASLDVTSRRNPEKVYHKMNVAELGALAHSFNWTRYFAEVNEPKMESLNVAVPDYFKGIEVLLKNQPLPVWKTYLKLRLIHNFASVLPTTFDEADFAFYGKYLTGAKEQKVRWKRCVAAVDGDLGEALGKAYVDKTFGADGKQRTLEMVRKLEAALGQDLEQLTWMTPATKQKAIDKLHALTNKIGYPDRWRDYSALKIVKGDAAGNSMRGSEFEFNRELRKIGKPVDRGEWDMTPPTVNAYYDPQMNNINFPAGILQPPFFDKQADDAANYGAIGAVIGHEMTHGFDDQGRQFDPKGNLEDWWTAADVKAFDQREQCLVDEYSAFQLRDGTHLNGKLTLGENTADNGGLRLAWIALMSALANRTLPPKEGFATEQRFFLAWGQSWCQNATEEVERMQAQTNPHSIARFRVNGVISNMPEFQKAFSCPATAPMVRPPANACRVW